MSTNTIIFDLYLAGIERGNWMLERGNGETLQLRAPDDAERWAQGFVDSWGAVTQLAVGGWRFNPYHDQSLMRIPQFDDPQHARLGWCCDAKPDGFTSPDHLIPGDHGGFVEDQTTPLTLPIPLEFAALCDQFNMSPEVVLRGFIADVAGLMNYLNCPRADRYSANGSDERMLADQYMERAYGVFRNEFV